ncbi:Uncharacterized protein SCF082_LOCUS10019 [Durusdinium trenchii]|uniref:Uncharacterized protein n=1 Tax=Durusdinium trenchii TaxID=1381693 RepID=A0ABP0J3B9_9DINO
MPVSKFSVDIVKGWTRATCVAFIMLAVSEMDPTEDLTKSLAQPLEKVLDRAWLLPMHVAIGMNKDQQSFRNMSLSFRGAERQAPSALQMALRFSTIMDRQAGSTAGNTETRLKKVIKQFNSSDGLHVRHQIDADKERSILNLIVGTSKDTRDIMSQHLAFVKWRESAFSTELLKGSRWLVGARPKGLPDSLQEVLTVTPQAQAMLMELHVKRFLQATRRAKPSQRARARASPEEFEKMVDYACVFAHLRENAKKATSDPKVDGKLKDAFLAKDYFQDVEAVVASKNPAFQLKSLIVWTDLVEPPVLPSCLQGEESNDLLAAQEQAAASKFNEVKMKLAADCKAMNAFNSEKTQVAGKQHVAKVLHEKSQIETGAKVVADFMKSRCWIGLVPEWSMPAEVDTMLRATGARNQVPMEKVNVIGWVDLTKIGVITQKDVNKVGQWKLEDKLNDYKIEFRQFFVPVDLNALHHNRSMPGGFLFYLCVADMCLPSQGTAHRASRGTGKVEKADVNVFCFSKLWQNQVVSSSCCPLDESQFVVPGQNVVASSAEGRRNYTDAQETAQWLGGDHIPEQILSDLLNSTGNEIKPVMVVNAATFDGCLEKTCVKKGLPCVSQSEKQPHFVTSLKITKSFLLDLWKEHEGAMENALPRYVPEPNPEVLPSDPQEPSLKVCSLVDGCLCLPRNIRAEFLTDAIRGPEWRRMLQEFDRCFGTAATPEEPKAVSEGDDGSAQEKTSFDWPGAFDEPQGAEEWHAKYDSLIFGKFTWCPELTAYIVKEGVDSSVADPDAPKKFKLFIEANEAYTLGATDPFLTYGAGAWLLDNKAEAFLSDNAEHGHKGVVCKFSSDLDPVVLEESGHDSDLKTLRSVIQHCETSGMVDFEIGGHTFSRPASVVQGLSADKFDIATKAGSCMVWRPNNLQVTGLRATNAASFFLSNLLEASPGLRKVWRVRPYRPEKTLGAAKPMWFLSHTLDMAKGTVQRVV